MSDFSYVFIRDTPLTDEESLQMSTHSIKIMNRSWLERMYYSIRNWWRML